MHSEDVFEHFKGLHGEVGVKHGRLPIALEQHALVSPVGQKEGKGANGIHDWHAGRVEETDGEEREHVRVPILNQELTPPIHVFILRLCKFACFSLVTGAFSIAASTARVSPLQQQIGNVWRNANQQVGDDYCGAHVSVPLHGHFAVASFDEHIIHGGLL